MRSKGFRRGTRQLFRHNYRDKGKPTPSIYLRQYKRGDYVDIIVDPSIQKGMPHKYFHGKTGKVFEVNKRTLVVIMRKHFEGRIIETKVNVRIEHVRPSKCREEYLKRKAENKIIIKLAKERGEVVCLKRKPIGPRQEVVMSTEDNKPKEVFYEPYYEVY